MRQKGFTLIEILVVVFIIGIAVSGAAVFIDDGGAEKETDDIVEKFAAYSEYASELAVLSGEPVGLLLEPPEWRDDPLEQGWQYRWQIMTDKGWADTDQLPPVEIPNTMELLIFVEEQQWSWEKAPKVVLPIVAFYPSGDVTPFEIEFTHDDVPGESETVTIDVWGRVVWKEWAEQLEELKEQEELLDSDF